MEYPEDYLNKIIQGDSLEIMKGIPDNSIDTIITDPPYGLEFMGKEWDSPKAMAGQIAHNEDMRGAFAYGGTHTRGYAAVDLCLYQEWTKQWAKEALRIAKPGATLLCFGGTRTWHRMACGLEDAGWVIKDTLLWLYGSGFPKSLNIAKSMEKFLKEGNASWNGTGNSSNGALGYSKLQYEQGYRSKDYSNAHQNEFKIQNEIAKKWEGWGTALKPAWEPIIMAMKPNEGSYTENALKWGVAGLNIDGGRIGTEQIQAHYAPKGTFAGGEPDRGSDTNYYTNQGRFPANLLLNEEAAEMLDEQSGINASRFFYVVKASRSERDMGLDEFEPQKVNDGRQTPIDNPFQRGETPRHNIHPTVKPLKLMEYLCILTKTPTGGIVLDPFAGSGTTCMAAKKVGRDFIGIEKEPEYVKIAEARINAIQKSLL